jgi:hypothetical protein
MDRIGAAIADRTGLDSRLASSRRQARPLALEALAASGPDHRA